MQRRQWRAKSEPLAEAPAWSSRQRQRRRLKTFGCNYLERRAPSTGARLPQIASQRLRSSEKFSNQRVGKLRRMSLNEHAESSTVISRNEWFLLQVMTFVLGCQPEAREGKTAPSVEPSGVCADVSDALLDVGLAALFEVRAGAYCLDSNSPPQQYSGPTMHRLLCTSVSNDGCKGSESLQGAALLRYVRDDGSAAAVNVVLRRFVVVEEALAFYTRRVLAHGDPAHVGLGQLPGLPESALAENSALALRGRLVAEASHSDPHRPPREWPAESRKALPQILKRFSQHEVDARLPASVRRLPKEHRLKFGLDYHLDDAFGVAGLGQAAVGYYQRGSQRYRIIVAEAFEPMVVADIYRALWRLPGRNGLKDMPHRAFEVRETTRNGTALNWLVGRTDNAIVAVTDERYVAEAGTAAERQVRSLDRHEKLRILTAVLRSER